MKKKNKQTKLHNFVHTENAYGHTPGLAQIQPQLYTQFSFQWEIKIYIHERKRYKHTHERGRYKYMKGKDINTHMKEKDTNAHMKEEDINTWMKKEK